MVGRVGYAPTTPAMSMQYSTIELSIKIVKISNLVFGLIIFIIPINIKAANITLIVLDLSPVTTTESKKNIDKKIYKKILYFFF